MQEMRVRSLGWEDPLVKEMVTHSSILAKKSHQQRSLVGYTVHEVAKSHNLVTKQNKQKKVHIESKENVPECSFILLNGINQSALPYPPICFIQFLLEQDFKDNIWGEISSSLRTSSQHIGSHQVLSPLTCTCCC